MTVEKTSKAFDLAKKMAMNGFLRFIPDKIYLEIVYRKKMGRPLNLNNPQTFTEKLQWLKINDRNPEYSRMVDKYEVKKYIADKIGEQYVVPLYGVYNNFDEINFDELPQQFVIKCTHDSGGLVICRDKNTLDIAKAKQKIEQSLRRNWYNIGREWVYKNVKPRIIIEKYMEDAVNKDIRDYKFFCFNGKAKCFYISEALTDHDKARLSFYDMKYESMPIYRSDYAQFEEAPSKPKNFEKMIEFSEILSRNIPHVRVDWYEINGKLYFGELTFCTGSGFIPFQEYGMDKMLGDMMDIGEENKNGGH